MSDQVQLIIATRNAGKVREFERLAAGLDLALLPLSGTQAPEPEETGKTFAENAIIKARSAAAATGGWALGDDSGLCVDALGGRPGIHSARYAEGSDQTRWQKLLGELKDVPDGERKAAFVCVLALSNPKGETVTTEGRCEGMIARTPRGESGFGYDPVFVVADDPRHRTMAELSEEEKNALSHRGRAFAAMRPHLARIVLPAGTRFDQAMNYARDSFTEAASAVAEQVRGTGELGVLLMRAAGGETLTEPEWTKVREELIDLAKVVPSLAIFAAPGGMLLLPLVLKLLPFDLRPTAFQHSHAAPKK